MSEPVTVMDEKITAKKLTKYEQDKIERKSTTSKASVKDPKTPKADQKSLAISKSSSKEKQTPAASETKEKQTLSESKEKQA